jgi:predicted membrane protein
METNFKAKHHSKSGLTFSIVLILVGIVFLGINTGILPTQYKPLFSSWPIWCLFVGFYLLLDRSYFVASVLLTAGTFFIIPQIGQINPELNIPSDFTHLYWPVLLIVAGVYFALSKFFKPCCFVHGDFHKKRWSENKTNNWDTEDGYIHINSAFESRKNFVLDPIFKGGEVETGFGEVIIDLRKTTLAEGKTNLYVKVLFGSVIIIVPDGWNVQLRGDSVFGTFTDSRLSHSVNREDGRYLIIDGKCAFGECKLRD